jgi:hypothetical protein
MDQSMGLGNKEHANFISILGGKFCRRVPEGTEGAVTRINKLNKTVHEMFYDNFTGVLTDIRIKESADYGKSWEFVFDVNGEAYIIQVSYSNSYAKAFLKMLPNIDLSQKMTLTPSLKEVDGKPQSSLFVNQNGAAIKHAYTKDNPNGMPKMVQIKVKGNDVWDDTDILVFLTEMVNNDIIPKLGKRKIENTQAVSNEEKSDFDVNPDDLPFNRS